MPLLSALARKSQPVISSFLLVMFFTCILVPVDVSARPERLIVIDKDSRTLTVFLDGLPEKIVQASFGIDPVSDRRIKLDCATPEGLYRITNKKNSQKYLFFMGLSYPEPADAWQAWLQGVITSEECSRILKAGFNGSSPPINTSLGYGIGIHGGGVYNGAGGKPARDWTQGCIALDDQDMKHVYAMTKPGDTVMIFHGGKDFYHLIRPFVPSRCQISNPLEGCPNGEFDGEILLETGIGEIRIVLRENRDAIRAVQCSVFTARNPSRPVLVLDDRDGDGRWSFGDRIEGRLDGTADPTAIYERIREAVVSSLRQGNIPRPSQFIPS